MEDYKPSGTPYYSNQEIFFVDLDVSEQKPIVEAVLSQFIRPFLIKDGGDVQCVHVSRDLIVIQYLGSCTDCSHSLTGTMDFMIKVLRAELSSPGLMIMSDS